jgi:hypothetical protein
MKTLLLFGFCLSILSLQAQKATALPECLAEISGIQYINDSTLIAHNDGGNESALYVLNFKGELKKKVIIKNIKNSDWEDITYNGDYIFIGDIGNNTNKRNKLKIYRVAIEDVLSKDSIVAQTMSFSYAEQTSYPPAKKELNFDAECLLYAEGFLWIFSKNRTEPFDGISNVYKFKFENNADIVLKKEYSISVGKSGWLHDSFTGGDYAFGYFYLITYNRILKYELENGKFNLIKEQKFGEYNQKEAITVIKENDLLVANEKQKLLGSQKLYRISFKK